MKKLRAQCEISNPLIGAFTGIISELAHRVKSDMIYGMINEIGDCDDINFSYIPESNAVKLCSETYICSPNEVTEIKKLLSNYELLFESKDDNTGLELIDKLKKLLFSENESKENALNNVLNEIVNPIETIFNKLK